MSAAAVKYACRQSMKVPVEADNYPVRLPAQHEGTNLFSPVGWGGRKRASKLQSPLICNEQANEAVRRHGGEAGRVMR